MLEIGGKQGGGGCGEGTKASVAWTKQINVEATTDAAATANNVVHTRACHGKRERVCV